MGARISRGALATRLSEYTRQFPPGCVAAVHKVRNQIDYDPHVLYTTCPSEIVNHIAKDPNAQYYFEVDLYREMTMERVRWGCCFFSQVRQHRSEFERQSRLKCAVTALALKVSDCSYGMKSFHVRAPGGIYSVFFADRFAKASLSVAAVSIGTIEADAMDALNLLSPGAYSITVAPHFEIPHTSEDIGIEISDIVTSSMEVAA